MASRTIPARIVSLICLLAILMVALPCATVSAHAATTMSKCDPCCPAQFSAAPACCTAAPQTAAVTAQPFAQALALDHQRLPLTHGAVPATPVISPTTFRTTLPPPLHPILRI